MAAEKRGSPKQTSVQDLPRSTGRITEWKSDRGFGYVESDGRRIFLHVRDFAERHKAPGVGDRVNFVMGTDRQGRSCAQRATHINDGGRFTTLNALALALLCTAPGLAVYRLSDVMPPAFLVGCWIAVSKVTYWIYAWDKRQARDQGWREPESLLHVFELLGGWPGAFAAQRRLRHKSSKASFQIGFWLIVAAHQFVAVDYLRGWPVISAVTREMRR